MSKEYLEALESIMKIYGNTNSLEGTYDYFLIIKKALQLLEAIDNVNPSETMRALDRNIVVIREKDFTIIRQALIKAQEMESENKALLEENKDLYFELALAEKQYKELMEYNKQYKNVLEIIKKKEVRLWLIKITADLKSYNYNCLEEEELTEEEFDLLKRWVG